MYFVDVNSGNICELVAFFINSFEVFDLYGQILLVRGVQNNF
jgi:hypothetical protein